MIFSSFPQGRIDYRMLSPTQYCEWEEYPRYIPDEPLWAPPFSLSIPNGICLGNHVMTGKGQLVDFDPPIYDVWTQQKIAPELRPFRPSEVEYVPGTVVTFNTSFGDSYGHWISEVVPCFHIARMVCQQDAKFYINLGRTDNFFKGDTLEALGFEIERMVEPESYPCQTPCFSCKDIIDSQFHPVIKADNVVFIRKTRYSWWARDFVRQSFLNLARPERTDRRLYISRSQENRRKILNEDQVRSLLTRYNFEIVESDFFWQPYHEQVKLFREADIVVTQRASIFYNLWYCKQHFKLIVLWQRDENHYPGIVDKFQDVVNIECEGIPSFEEPDDRNCDDIEVDIGALEQSLISLLD